MVLGVQGAGCSRCLVVLVLGVNSSCLFGMLGVGCSGCLGCWVFRVFWVLGVQSV